MRIFIVKSQNQSNWGYLIDGTELKEFYVRKYLDTSKKIRFQTKFSNEHTLSSIEGNLTELIEEQLIPNRDFVSDTWEELSNLPGQYYPTIYRPFLNLSHESSNYGNERIFALEELLYDEKKSQIEGSFLVENFDSENAIISFNQATILVRTLNKIFEFTLPSPSNLSSYGNATRDLLILTCTEFETHMKSILVKNNIRSIHQFYNTKDYVRLKDILHLTSYKVSINHYPTLVDNNPFINWETSAPTASLEWYDNYNKVKHDRENNFHLGSIKSCIDAICAVLIVLASKYGHSGILWNRELNDFFRFSSLPTFPKNELYIPPVDNDDWVEKSLTL